VALVLGVISGGASAALLLPGNGPTDEG